MNRRYSVLLGAAVALGFIAGAEGDAPDTEFEATKALTITLENEVYVKGPQLRLGELASLEGELAAEFAALEIGPAPRPGASATLNSALIETRIRNAGGVPPELVVKGARLVKATTLSRDILGVEIGDSLRTYVLAELPWDAQNALVDVTSPSYDVVVPEGDTEIRWVKNPTYKYIGPTAFKGEVYVDGALQRTVVARVDVQVFQDVLVAATDIPRGTRITGRELSVEKRDMSDLPHGTYSDPSDVMGLVAKSTIFPGAVLTQRKLDLPKLISRNQQVVVETRAGALVVRGNAIAKQDGREGDQIQCQNPKTKELIFGVVRRDGVVEVR